MTGATPTLSNQLDRSWAEVLTPGLHRLVADFEVLRFNVRGAMWNGWGEHYSAMLDSLPAFRNHAEEAVDALAKRIRCLEGRPPSTMEEMMALATLKPHDGTFHHRACMRMLSESLTHLLKQERELLTTAQHAGDEVTAQCIAQFMQFQEESLWLLRTSLRRSAFESEYFPQGGD